MLGIDFQYYIVCWVGALVLYFKLQNEDKPVIKFSTVINAGWAEHPFAVFLDILMFSCTGAFVGTIFTQPSTFQQSLAAGLGWTGLIATSSLRSTGENISQKRSGYSC